MSEQNPAKKPGTNPTSLRQRAEARVTSEPPDTKKRSAADAARQVHELRVHQAELEIQNEELRAAQFELAAARDRYLDLYEFAPVGYVTLDRHKVIREANLTAAALLGTARQQLPGARLEQFVARDDRDTCFSYLHEAMSGAAETTCELRFTRPDASTFYARLDLVAGGSGTAVDTEYRVALTDVTRAKQAEAERERVVAELRKALAAVKTLRGLLPICAHCRRVRDDAGYWERLDVYISQHTDTRFSHGLCPECLRTFYPEYADAPEDPDEPTTS